MICYFFWHSLGRTDLLDFLIRNRANVNVVKDNKNQDTALILAIDKGKQISLNCDEMENDYEFDCFRNEFCGTTP